MIPTLETLSSNKPLKIKAGWTGFDSVSYRHSIKYFLKKIEDGDPYRVLPLGVSYRIEVLWQVRAPKEARVYFEEMWKVLFARNSDILSALNGYTECREASQNQVTSITEFFKNNFIFTKPEGGYTKDWEVLYLIRLHPLEELPEIPEKLIEVAKSHKNGIYKKVIEDFLEGQTATLLTN